MGRGVEIKLKLHVVGRIEGGSLWLWMLLLVMWLMVMWQVLLGLLLRGYALRVEWDVDLCGCIRINNEDVDFLKMLEEGVEVL